MRRPVLARFPALIVLVAFCAVFASWRVADAQNEPNGPFANTCSNATIDKNGTLFATCVNFFQQLQQTQLPNARACHTIWNVDGYLRCVISEHPSQSGRDIFDIISLPEDIKTAKGETREWRIDHPDVIDPQRNYPLIRFKPGDEINFYAGGCSQTGGSGSTWKSYVFPSGDSADHLYSGLLWVPGVTGGGLQRIAAVLNRRYVVPDHLAPQVAQNLFLWLGFQDDGYGDNGYYSHDDGNNNQCQNVGPAYVIISIFSPAKVVAPQGVSWAPYKKPFDMTWDVNMAGDDNGLPINPLWAYQVDHKNAKPDFQATCGSSFSGGDTVHDDVLAQTCTSQLPTTDLFSEGFPDDVWTFFTLCKSDLLQGHLNWALATYSGSVQWQDAESGWPHDSDYNMGLVSPNNAGETNNESTLGLEFDAKETVDGFGSSFWKTFANDSDAAKGAVINGRPAFVTGLIGMDAVHGGYTEVHPVLSLAMLIKEVKASDEKSEDETWAFFIRNQGDEGECSEQEHLWNAVGGDSYAIQMSWPDDASDVSITGSASDVWSSVSGASAPTLEKQAPWTYLEFHLPPPGSGDGYDGTVTLHYTFKTTKKHEARRVAITHTESLHELDDTDWAKVETAAFPDPTLRTTFDSRLRVQPEFPHVAMHAAHLRIESVIASHHTRDDASKRGELKRAESRPSAIAAVRNATLKTLYVEHAKFLAPVHDLPTH